MAGCFVNFRDGVSGRIASFLLTETYAGVLAGTLTVATRHILPRLMMKMSNLGEEKAKGYFCLPPDLVEEKDVMNYSEEQFCYLSENTSVDKCLKELNAKVTICIPDKDGYHLITIEWFLAKEEMENEPLRGLIQKAVGQLSFDEIRDYCEYSKWSEL